MNIADYLDELDRALAFDPGLSRRVRPEIESHLREAAEVAGEAVAIRRFGAPSDIARAYAEAGLPARLRRAWFIAVLLLGVTFVLMRLRTLWLDLPVAADPLTLIDRGGLVAALACVLLAWARLRRLPSPPTRVAPLLHVALGLLALSVGASLLRAAEAVPSGGAAPLPLMAASAVAELALVVLLLGELGRADRYRRRAAA
ncbi:MAG: hypothetical protein U0S50_10285 [Sphingopyxis sp.]|uniref:HAAS signaling domain-containing protein n=1 Tax=Sphingopyxis sp. TaxID=1908224 RepID=UPI002AB9D79D|nr:hypothetical protein [Sphingopyxis sp.]MDZ3832193.1 hypothetical protein [Sphingopyxis sp.]